MENAVAKHPAMDGRFPMISGFKAEICLTDEPYSRVKSLTKPDGTPIESDAIYTLTTSEYVSGGCDGFDCFKEATPLYDKDVMPLISDVVTLFFKRTNKSWRCKDESREKIREKRHQKLGCNLNSTAAKDWSDCGKFAAIHPHLEQRI